jgi:two-component system response regulator
MMGEGMNISHQVEILLVEDNPNDAELTLRAFRARNLANQVFVARDGAEALDFFFGDGPHPLRDIGVVPKVVLLDLRLPKVDGLEVLRRLKTDERTRELPVVVLTSSREEPDIAAAYGLGANSYIVKPVDFEAFARAVSEVGLFWVLLNEPPR